ncbi:MAG: 23S rRNA (pseudouridine(1915)-N(3))-methyltransferase RlmH [Paludibacter sp.]|jgi:23S rRNA (pseudouridine1915-N3)-methyltransferase|nr:23S rRNA (pseudouridine(1915)-N(3))-methyltransferase RlmH [Paludibacter sp.]MBP7611674.1 23S rRNA (pseudouridine(1915)-N(3))-methyltransferase RlmH [Paludibacter sp.]MBV5281328.1 23S rRNA (pseudouridine(1915)-N(3))-methyltransferase RlmH [Paludibacter sp.]
MKITLLTVGKTTNANLVSLQDEYQNRLKFYIPFEMVVIPELKNTKNLSIAEQQEKEADLILKQLETSDEVVLLDDKGKQFTSMGFSEYISKKMLASHKRMVFVVGGPYGFSERVYNRANGKVSLSAMTFSHQMIRLIFVEQLYRAMTILKGEPYHHE